MISIVTRLNFVFENVGVNSWNLLIGPKKNITKLFEKRGIHTDIFRRIVHIDEHIFYDAMGLGDVDQNSFQYISHVPLNINTMRF